MPVGSKMAGIVQRGRLIVGVSQNTYLFGHRDSRTGELVGFEVDLAREIARALFGDPTKIQFRAMSAAERIPALQNGDVDIVVRAMTMTCDRWQQISFSTEYYSGGQRLLVPVDSPVKSIDDLGGKKVCAATGSTNITAIAAAKSKPVPVAATDALDCMVLLQQGQIDAVSSDDAILAGFAAQDPNTHVVGPAFAAAPYGIGIAKPAPELVQFVNGVLERVRADGTWAAIHQRWLSTLGPAAPPAAKYQT
jgi:polar amino acid transport system substrate-binding protein